MVEPNLYEPKFIRELLEFDIGELGSGGFMPVVLTEASILWLLRKRLSVAKSYEGCSHLSHPQSPGKFEGVLFLATIPLDVVLLIEPPIFSRPPQHLFPQIEKLATLVLGRICVTLTSRR